MLLMRPPVDSRDLVLRVSPVHMHSHAVQLLYAKSRSPVLISAVHSHFHQEKVELLLEAAHYLGTDV